MKDILIFVLQEKIRPPHHNRNYKKNRKKQKKKEKRRKARAAAAERRRLEVAMRAAATESATSATSVQQQDQPSQPQTGSETVPVSVPAPEPGSSGQQQTSQPISWLTISKSELEKLPSITRELMVRR